MPFGIPHFTSYYTITRYHHVVKSLSILYCNISSIIGAIILYQVLLPESLMCTVKTDLDHIINVIFGQIVILVYKIRTYNIVKKYIFFLFIILLINFWYAYRYHKCYLSTCDCYGCCECYIK